MTKLMITFLGVVTLIALFSCTGRERQLDGATIDSVVVSRMVPLAKGSQTPSGQIKVSLEYLRGGALSGRINHCISQSDVIPVQLFDLKAARTSVPALAHATAKKYAEQYMADNRQIYLEDSRHAALYNEKVVIRGYFVDGPDGFINYVSQIGTDREATTVLTHVKVISTVTGEEARFSDIFNPGSEMPLTDLIIEQLGRSFDAKDLKELRSKLVFADQEPYVSPDFILGRHDVTFIYTPGEIASNRLGEIRVKIGRNKMKRMLK